MSMPAPKNTSAASRQTSALLFACTVLCSMTVQIPGAIGSGPDTPGGQAPSWGGGASSLFSDARLTPAPLCSNTEFSSRRRPPASVAEKPMSLCCAVSWSKTVLQSGQPAMWKPESAMFDHDTAKHNVIGLSATDAGGRLLLEHSVFEHNGDGVNLASENNEDAPPPQDGACPSGVAGPEPIAPGICTVIEHNTIGANNNTDVSPDTVEEPEGFLGVGIDISGGQPDLVFKNHVSDQGSYSILTTVYVNALTTGRPGPRFPNANCQQGRFLLPGACFFNASGNLIADNALGHDGTFANPTSGDLADATVADTASNCYRGNTHRSGRPTTAPHGLQPEDCAGRRGRTVVGVLGVQVACAARAFGGCHWGTGNAVLSSLATLSHLLHIPFDASTVRNTRAIYPSPGRYVAPRPASQPSLHPMTRP